MNKSGLITFRSLHRLVTWGAFSLLPAMFAANGPPPVTVNQPVNVIVTNPDTAPAQVQDVNNPAFQPYQAEDLVGVISPNGHYKTAKFDVPPGKRLVIELVTFYVVLEGGQTVSDVELAVTKPGGTVHVRHHLTPSRIGPVPGSATGIAYSVCQPLRAYSEAGANSVELRVERNGTTGLYLTRFSISGYLVDAP
jgi:hypothetical protein